MTACTRESTALSRTRAGDIMAMGSIYGTTGTATAKGTEGGVSWSASISYKPPIGLIPYFTASRQNSVVAGEGSELYLSNILSGNVLGKSNLLEAGPKGEFLDKKLLRRRLGLQAEAHAGGRRKFPLTNQRFCRARAEAEIRWAVDRHLLVTGASPIWK
jgi:iron complex outermembrane receptor protein